MIPKSIFDFLRALKKNNDREWFKANKVRYDTAKKDFEAFTDLLINAIGKFDKEVLDLKAKDCTFRIFRDVRFSKDKSPYKTNFGAHVVKGGRKNMMAGYYFHLEPGNSFLAGGAYMPPSPWLKAIRQEIDYNSAEFKKIINQKDFKKYFGELSGDKLKTAPRDYPKDHPEIELLRFKDYVAMHPLTDKQVVSNDSLTYFCKVFRALQPFDRFLNSVNPEA